MYMENRFIRADDVAQELNVSKPYGFRTDRRMDGRSLNPQNLQVVL